MLWQLAKLEYEAKRISNSRARGRALTVSRLCLDFRIPRVGDFLVSIFFRKSTMECEIGNFVRFLSKLDLNLAREESPPIF